MSVSKGYLVSGGIIHFGNERDGVEEEAYIEYLSVIRPGATASFEQGVIDDHGVVLAEKGLRITNLIHKIRGILDVDKGLELNNASVENTKGINVSGPLNPNSGLGTSVYKV